MAAVIVPLAALDRRGQISEGLWRDEAQAVCTARSASAAQFFDRMPRDFNPPLFHVILAGVGRAIGFDEFPLKAFAQLLGLLVIPAVALVAVELFGLTGAATAACLAALSPVLISLSAEVRPYSLTAILGCLSLWLVLRLFRKAGEDRVSFGSLLALAVVLILLAYAHYSGLLMAGAIGCVALLALWMTSGERNRWRAVAAACALAGLAFLPWLPVLLRQVRSGLPYSRPPSWEEMWEPLLEKLRPQVPRLWWGSGGQPGAATNAMMCAWFLILLAGIVVIARERDGEKTRQRQIACALVLGVALVIALLMRSAPQEPRYFVLIAALTTALIGGMIGVAGARHWFGRGLLVVVLAGVIGSHLATLPGRASGSEGPPPKSGVRTICQHGGLRPEDLVVLAPDYLGSTFWYYCWETPTTHGFPIWSNPSLPDWYHYREAWSSPTAIAETTERIRGTLHETGSDHFFLIWLPGLSGGTVEWGSRIRQLRAALADEYSPGEPILAPGRAERVFLLEYKRKPAGQSYGGVMGSKPAPVMER